MKTAISYILIALCLTLNLNAMASSTPPSLERWQMDMIFHPCESVLQRESRGFVFIFDGFNETQVDKIYGASFDRIDHMMFTRVKLTDSSGKIRIGPDAGDELLADDGCD